MYIQITNVTSRAAEALANIDDIIKSREKLAQIKKVADAVIGYPADYSQLSAVFGIPAEDCETFYNLLAGATSALGASAIEQYTSEVGL